MAGLLKRFSAASGPSTIVGIVILAVVSSFLYDLIVRPGLSVTGRAFLNVVTLGSTTLRDSAYGSTALDPTPVTALILVIGALGLLVCFAFGTVVGGDYIGYLADVFVQPETEDEEEVATRGRSTRRRVRPTRLIIVLKTVLILLTLVALAAGAVHNQSVLIWRTFHANFAIVKPFVSETERDDLLSRFASVRSQNQYALLQERLEQVAAKNNVDLHLISLW